MPPPLSIPSSDVEVAKDKDHESKEATPCSTPSSQLLASKLAAPWPDLRPSTSTAGNGLPVGDQLPSCSSSVPSSTWCSPGSSEQSAMNASEARIKNWVMKSDLQTGKIQYNFSYLYFSCSILVLSFLLTSFVETSIQSRSSGKGVAAGECSQAVSEIREFALWSTMDQKSPHKVDR